MSTSTKHWWILALLLHGCWPTWSDWRDKFDDFDGDGFNHYEAGGEDCNDHNIDVHPDAVELCDDIDNDCDGLIDALIPVWFENGVNTMFPIEVGTWNASIAPWRKEYGRELRGVGGMNKTLFAFDRAAIDGEVDRLRPLVELGGYIPCPDHRIAPDAKWDNVRYYCDRMHRTFG